MYKNLLQEIAQRVASPLPRYTTYRHGLGHLPAFTGIVELAGITFRGEPAKNKKQAEKNAALAAWLSLKQCKRLSRFFGSTQVNRVLYISYPEPWDMFNIIFHIKPLFSLKSINCVLHHII